MKLLKRLKIEIANNLPSRASFQCAMLSIPSGYAQTRSVLALTVLVASRITKFRVAHLTVPSVIALTLVIHAPSMRPAAQVAQFH